MSDTDSRLAAIRRSNRLTLGCLACLVTATSQLPREVNKFLLPCVILFKRIIFRQFLSAFAKEYLIAAMY